MGGTREPWYKNAIIYGVDVATFQDANGDGIGDFMGVCDRLDYLTELGVTCLWLLSVLSNAQSRQWIRCQELL